MEIYEIDNVTEYSLSYKIILCDLWGVIHNGVKLFDDAESYLKNMKQNGIDVYLISNAPRPEEVVSKGLKNKLNLNNDLFKKIYTSGDIGTKYINSKIHGETYFHLGPEKDHDLLENIKIHKSEEINRSEFVVCTGLYDDNKESPEDYRDFLSSLLTNNKELVCVNPDEIVYRDSKRIYCAGALGKSYEKMGGKVTYYGKPHPEIYNHVISDLLDKTKASKKDILAIGDSMKTDCLGACQSNLDFVFIKNGIHKNEISNKDDLIALSEAILPRSLKSITYSEELK